MMGRGAEGGTHQFARITSSVHGGRQQKGVDIYSQVQKALAVKSPFREDNENSGGGALPFLSAPLSLKLSSSLENKRKNRAKKTQARGREGGPVSKKRHYGDDPTVDASQGQYWAQMEDYFQEVNSSDIQLLLPTTFPLLASDGSVCDPCLLIPPPGTLYTETWDREDAKQAEKAVQQSVTRVKRKILAASPVSKKSKRLSGEVVTTVISPPPEHEDEELCHVCNGGDSDESNQILFCDVCNVAVHQDCYGVPLVPEGQWLCSWCSHKALRMAENDANECVLCPVRGGALKPVAEVDGKGCAIRTGMKFAHLFCCQWVPETYIASMEAMEPIRNVDGVRDERWRLLCSVCKEKQGACIQCSHGLCATAFHPLCAREAKLWMEVSSREDSEEVDLRAYCPKHSSGRMGKVYVAGNEGSEGGTSQIKLVCNTNAVKASDSTGATAGLSQSDDKTRVTEQAREEQMSPHEDVSSTIMDRHTCEGKAIPRSVMLSHLAQDPTQCPTMAGKSLARLIGDRNLDASGDTLNEGAAGMGGGLLHSTKCADMCGERMDTLESVHYLKQISHPALPVPYTSLPQGYGRSGKPELFVSIKEDEQGDQVEVSSRTESWLSCHSSHLEGTGKEGGRSSSSNKAPNRKNGLRKLSLSARRCSTSQVENDKPSNAQGLVKHDCEKIKRRDEYVEAPEDCESTEVAVVTSSDEKGSEERRQRGLSGEASTSQSHASSPAESPAAAGRVSSPIPHQKERQEAMVEKPHVPCASLPTALQSNATDAVDAGPSNISRAGIQDSKDRADLGLAGEQQALSSAKNGESSDNARGAVSRKSLRQGVVRADIGKLSIVPSKKIGSWAETYMRVSEGDMESREVVTVCKIPTAVRSAKNDSKTKVASSKLVMSGSQKISEAPGSGLSVDAAGPDPAPELRRDNDKQPMQTDHGASKVGCGASAPQGKCLVVSENVPSPNSEGELLQTAAMKPDILLQAKAIEYTREAPQAYVHPYLLQRLTESQQSCGTTKGSTSLGSTNRTDPVASPTVEQVCLVAEQPANVIAGEDGSQRLGMDCKVGIEVNDEERIQSLEKQWEQLQAAESGGVLLLAPDDEIEGELLVLQNMLLDCAQVNRIRCEQLITRLVPRLAEERAVSRRQGQDLAMVHHYLSQAREAKKQGRKEKREKEAQAVLAAATAAAAASPRVGYVKRDAPLSDHDTYATPQETTDGSPGILHIAVRHLKPPVPKPTKLLIPPGHPALSRSTAQAKATFLKQTLDTKTVVQRTASPRLQAAEGSSICDICSNGDMSRSNKIVACDRCKVAVHQECYGIGRIPLGVWWCQPCAELQQFQALRSPDVEARAKFWVQCALCGGRSGAFKRCTDGHWVHVFCAQWMPETTVGKDQAASIEGMEAVPPERYALLCSICHHQQGACLTCNFGHCHGAFHPSCARDSGLYMNVKSSPGGRFQYRAYCERHSPQQRAKAELRQRSGCDDMNALRQIRVEFERVRLICERICRRERLKRDVLQSAKEVYLAQLLCAAQLSSGGMEQSKAFVPSWMNGTTSMLPRGVPLGTVQQSAVQSKRSPERRAKDEKEHMKKHKKYKKHAETKLHREKLMTPTEASMQNLRLPKGYAYVPVDVYVKGTMAPPRSDINDKHHLSTLPSQSP